MGFEHWYRRMAHIAASSFVSYYLLPDDGWIGISKKVAILFLLLACLIFDLVRLKGRGYRFFCLRRYEEERVGSYVYFVIGTVILLLIFPQQIAIPCIISASLIDPVVGEVRRFKHNLSYIVAFAISFLIFYSAWLTSPCAIPVSLISAAVLVLSEFKKFRYMDDDLLMQIAPAIVMLLLYIILGEGIMPRKLILPLVGVK